MVALAQGIARLNPDAPAAMRVIELRLEQELSLSPNLIRHFHNAGELSFNQVH